MRSSFSCLRKAIAGVEESQFFTSMRRQILSDLEANANDRSLAGRVDPQIADLVHYINTAFPQYVTSSSCAGRVSLFHKGVAHTKPTAKDSADEATASVVASSSSSASASASTTTPTAPPAAAAATAAATTAAAVAAERRKRGSFGQGTLYQSHDPLPADTALVVTEAIVPALERFWSWRQAAQSLTLTPDESAALDRSEVLQLKFEPMILHVLCADIEAAAELLKCGSESGQMNSGIVSCSRGTKAHRKITCCITSPLCVDVPLFAHRRWCLPNTEFRGEVWRDFLAATLHHVNVLFDENARRRERFVAELRSRVSTVAAPTVK